LQKGIEVTSQSRHLSSYLPIISQEGKSILDPRFIFKRNYLGELNQSTVDAGVNNVLIANVDQVVVSFSFVVFLHSRIEDIVVLGFVMLVTSNIDTDRQRKWIEKL
jgi:hypothetical protein